MSRLSKKEIITKIVFDSLPDKSSYHDLNIEKLSFRWFVTGRTGSGLRLTEEGLKGFTDANIEYFDFIINHSIKGLLINPSIFVMDLSKVIDCPYYLGIRKQDNKPEAYIRLYDSKTAILVNLYGNIDEYIVAKKNK